MLEMKFKRLSDTMIVPTKAHDTDACFDIYADTFNLIYADTFGFSNIRDNGEVCIFPHETVIIPTGFATNIPHGYWGAIFARSGLASKQGLRPANCVAVIDESYTGEWKIPLHNDGEDIRVIHHGDRIAQFTLLPYYDIQLEEVDELDETDRGSGGFGSSGR